MMRQNFILHSIEVMQKITIIKYSNTKILFITVLGQKFASHGENQHPANILLKNHPSITQ